MANGFDKDTMAEDSYRKTREMAKKFVTPKEGMELYSMGREMFLRISREAHAIYKLSDSKLLINTEIFEKYMEVYRL